MANTVANDKMLGLIANCLPIRPLQLTSLSTPLPELPGILRCRMFQSHVNLWFAMIAISVKNVANYYVQHELAMIIDPWQSILGCEWADSLWQTSAMGGGKVWPRILCEVAKGGN